jgi:hypothetical protein
LHRPHTRFGEAVDLIQPLAATSPDITCDDDAEGEAMDFGQGFAVHFPCEEDFFVCADFAVRNGNGVVENILLPASEVRLMSTGNRLEGRGKGKRT